MLGASGVEKIADVRVAPIIRAGFHEAQAKAKQGDLRAQVFIGGWLSLGFGDPFFETVYGYEGYSPNPEAAEHYLLPAAKLGNTYAQFHLAILYQLSDDARKQVEANTWIFAAAKNECPCAILWLVSAYYKGEFGFQTNAKEAFMWLSKAAVANPDSQDVQLQMGIALRDGMGTSIDLSLARQWLYRAASHGQDYSAAPPLARHIYHLLLQDDWLPPLL